MIKQKNQRTWQFCWWPFGMVSSRDPFQWWNRDLQRFGDEKVTASESPGRGNHSYYWTNRWEETSFNNLSLKLTIFWRFPAKTFRQKKKQNPNLSRYTSLRLEEKKGTIKFANLFGRRKSTSSGDEPLRLSLEKTEAVAPKWKDLRLLSDFGTS